MDNIPFAKAQRAAEETRLIRRIDYSRTNFMRQQRQMLCCLKWMGCGKPLDSFFKFYANNHWHKGRAHDLGQKLHITIHNIRGEIMESFAVSEVLG